MTHPVSITPNSSNTEWAADNIRTIDRTTTIIAIITVNWGVLWPISNTICISTLNRT